MFTRPKIGLALGGGGARGLAHIGVIKVLEREHIPIHIITGTSAGAVIGGMYAQNPSIDVVEHKMRAFLSGKDFKKTGIEHANQKPPGENFFKQLAENLKERLMINIACSRISLVANKRLQVALFALLENGNIEETAIRFGALSSDLVTGKSVLCETGDIIQAIMASASLPGFLPPLENDDQKLIDGVVTDPIPVKAAFSMGADVVIAVDVSTDLNIQKRFDNIVDVVMRNNQITGHFYKELLLENADVVIRPEVGAFHWSEFDKIDIIIEKGAIAALKVVSALKSITRRRIRFNKKSFQLS